MAADGRTVNSESHMPTEIEAKFRLTDPAALQQRLAQLGAQAAGSVLETDRIFDAADHRLRAAGCGLRVRTSRRLDAGRSAADPSPALTFKGPRAAGALKIREELETLLGDATASAHILERLGFRPVVVYEKRRKTWRLGECTVTLDEMPALGWFVEIEGPDVAAVETRQTQLGLAQTALVRESYVELAAAHGHPAADGCSWLLFDPDAYPT